MNRSNVRNPVANTDSVNLPDVRQADHSQGSYIQAYALIALGNSPHRAEGQRLRIHFLFAPRRAHSKVVYTVRRLCAIRGAAIPFERERSGRLRPQVHDLHFATRRIQDSDLYPIRSTCQFNAERAISV